VEAGEGPEELPEFGPRPLGSRMRPPQPSARRREQALEPGLRPRSGDVFAGPPEYSPSAAKSRGFLNPLNPLGAGAKKRVIGNKSHQSGGVFSTIQPNIANVVGIGKFSHQFHVTSQYLSGLRNDRKLGRPWRRTQMHIMQEGTSEVTVADRPWVLVQP
jgi:hypothetical protein